MSILKRQRPDSGDGKAPSVERPMREIVLPLLNVALPHITGIAKALDEEKWGENFGNPISMQITGTEVILQCMREEKVSTEVVDLCMKLMRRTAEDKGPDAGLVAMPMYLLED